MNGFCDCFHFHDSEFLQPRTRPSQFPCCSLSHPLPSRGILVLLGIVREGCPDREKEESGDLFLPSK